jgi:hypothetical protein
MNPYVLNQGGLIAGDMLSRIGQHIEARADENKRILQAGKAADAFFKAIPEGNRPIPIEQWEMQSPMDKASAMTGFIGAQHYKKGQEDLLDALAQRQQREAQTANAGKLPGFYGDVSRYNEPGQLPYNMPVEEFNKYALPQGQEQPGLRELTAAAQHTGYGLDPRTLDDLMRAQVTAAGAKGKETFFKAENFGVGMPVKTPEGTVLPGHRIVVTGPNTSQMFPEQAAMPTVYTDPTSGQTFFNSGKGWQHLPMHSEMAPEDRIAAQAAVKAVLDSPQAMGWAPEKRQAAVEAVLAKFRAPAGRPSPAPAPTGKVLTKEQAAILVQQAGGDKEKARKLAREAGYQF